MKSRTTCRCCSICCGGYSSQWEEAGGRGTITAAMATNVGGLAEALDRDAETVYRDLSPEEQRVAQVLFRRITEAAIRQRFRKALTSDRDRALFKARGWL